jgi:hypothetical protein
MRFGLPTGFVAPSLPTTAPRPPSGDQWLHEIKHDGFRVIARKDGKRVKLYSRPGNDLTERFPLIVEALARREAGSRRRVGSMAVQKGEIFEPVTIGHIRSHGCRDLLVYCASGRCHHSATLNADWLSDATQVRSLCPRMVCTRCGMLGADVRPDWGPHVNKRHV